MSYMAMYIISVHIVNSNSKSSVGANHWKLNIEEGKVLQADDETAGNSKGSEDDHLFTILKNRRVENGEWKVDSELECQSCQSNNFHREESVER